MAATILERLHEHLQALQHSNTPTSINVRLLEDAGLALPEQLAPEATLALVQQVSMILRQTKEDPAPLTQFLERLLQSFTFADVLSFDPPIDFAAGLLPMDSLIPINNLMLYLLKKATSATDVATIAGWPEVVRALVKLWLCSSNTGTAIRASTLLCDCLSIDKSNVSLHDQQLADINAGQGLMWRRIFGDTDVYATLFDCCDLKFADQDLSKRQITLAQARLLEVLPRWAKLDWSAVSKSHSQVIEAQHNITKGGLLDFASLHMIDIKDDIITHVCLLEFFSDLLASTKHEAISQGLSTGLDYLISSGVHERVSNLYLADAADDPLESVFLYGPASRYLAVYSSDYPQHYMSSTLQAAIEQRLFQKFDLSASQWAHAEPPKYDLHLLASLPRISLLPGRGGSQDWAFNPLLRLPSASAPPEVLETLASIFHGPTQEVITFPQASPMIDVDHGEKVDDGAAARTLYFQYLAYHRTLWKDVVAHAETIAILDRALAALKLLTAVITANWSAEREYDLPSNAIATPESGVIAILSPPALEYVIPYLNRPAQTFSNLVGGRGDAESSAYKIAVAKYDALRALHSRLAAFLERTPDLDLQAVLVTLERRLSEGPLSKGAEVGGRIATLEL